MDQVNAFIRTLLVVVALLPVHAALSAEQRDGLRGSGNLGIIIERASGSIVIVDTTKQAILARVQGLGDLSHASAVFSPDQRYAFVFGRDGGLTKIDLLTERIVKRVIQGGNAIGGAISDDGQLIAVSNYTPGGVKVFDSETLDLIADIPATYGANNQNSKTVGLADAPGRRFVYSLYDGGEIWIADFSAPGAPVITKFTGAGDLPYDGLIAGNGRHYIAGLFGESGLAHIDLWAEKPTVRRILPDYTRGQEKLPVYKMPHLQGWALADDRFILPAVGLHQLLAIDSQTFKEIGRVNVHSQPIFAVARPDGRQVWVNFAHPDNDTIQVVDVPSLKVIHQFKPGPAALHMEFTPRGHRLWLSVRDLDKVQIYDARTFAKVGELDVVKPSGIFFTNRAAKIGL